jgi:L-seryl-tRNA(Ser) seleniumtransferase
VPIPTWVVALRPRAYPADALAGALRRREVPVVARVRDNAVLLDLRTVEPDDLEVLAAAVLEVGQELAEA